MWGCGFGAMTLAVRPRHFSPAQVSGLSAWYDPSDLTTLYQDVAMTVPVTEPGQSVAAMRDKSGNGRHMLQAVSAARPIYGREPVIGRRNLLTYTEDMSNTVWTRTARNGGVLPTVGSNMALAPDGSATADTVTINRTGLGGLSLVSQLMTDDGTQKVRSLYIKASRAQDVGKTIDAWCYDGTVKFREAIILPEQWTRVELSPIMLAAGASREPLEFGYLDAGSLSPDTGEIRFDVWGAQVEAGAVVTPYQRVVSSYDVTELGGASRAYLSFDGVDDFLTTPVKPIAGTSVFAGVAFAPNPGVLTGNHGVFSDAHPMLGGVGFGWAGGTQQRIVTYSTTTESLSGSYALSSDPQRRNMQAVFTGPSPFAYFRDAGFVSFAPAYVSTQITPLTLGRGHQNGATGYLAGRVYGALYAAANRSEAEALLDWVKRTCGVTV